MTPALWPITDIADILIKTIFFYRAAMREAANARLAVLIGPFGLIGPIPILMPIYRSSLVTISNFRSNHNRDHCETALESVESLQDMIKCMNITFSGQIVM